MEIERNEWSFKDHHSISITWGQVGIFFLGGGGLQIIAHVDRDEYNVCLVEMARWLTTKYTRAKKNWNITLFDLILLLALKIINK